MALIEKWRKEGCNPTLLLTPSKNNRKKRRPVPTLTPKVGFLPFFLAAKMPVTMLQSLTLGKSVFQSSKKICGVCNTVINLMYQSSKKICGICTVVINLINSI
jgi:hypothetical protein